MRSYRIDAAVVIDSPVLHLPLAAKAHALNIPTLYYIAPQMWAWGMYRIHKLRSNVDRVACILPFEEKFFRDEGIDATFVGHPLAEQFSETRIDRQASDRMRGRGQPFVALLPGSRRHVVESVLPGQLEVAGRIKAELPRAAFGVSVANPQVAPIVDALVSRSNLDVLKCPRDRAELIHAADLVLVASGTTALEVAFHERPMIVMYNASRLFYQVVGRWMISTEFLSLPNILAGREVVPEFMPYYTDTAPIADRAIELLRDDAARGRMQRDLLEVVAPLKGARASRNAAEILLTLARERHH
jgi:lipid-A-disaccharide synthase